MSAPRLSLARPGSSLVLVRITEEGEAAEGLLDFCYDNRLQPGRIFKVTDSGDVSITLEFEPGRQLAVPSEFAEYICCSPAESK